MGPVRGEGALGVMRRRRVARGEPPGAAGMRRRYGAAVVVGLQLLIVTDISGMRGRQELLIARGVRRVSAWGRGRGREALALVLVRVLRHDMRMKNRHKMCGVKDTIELPSFRGGKAYSSSPRRT